MTFPDVVDLIAVMSSNTRIMTLVPDFWEQVNAARLHLMTLTLDVALPNASALAILLYTCQSNLYKQLNVDLRQVASEAVPATRSLLVDTWRPFMRSFLVGLTHMPTHRDEIWRGLPHPHSQFAEQYTPGTKVRWNGFTSCATSPFKAWLFAVRISTTETAGIPDVTLFCCSSVVAHCLAAVSMYPAEEEVVVPCGSEFAVVSSGKTVMVEVHCLVHVAGEKGGPNYDFYLYPLQYKSRQDLNLIT